MWLLMVATVMCVVDTDHKESSGRSLVVARCLGSPVVMRCSFSSSVGSLVIARCLV